MTQTTLSIDDTSEVIEALKEKYPSIQGPRKMIFVMRLLIDSKLSEN